MSGIAASDPGRGAGRAARFAKALVRTALARSTWTARAILWRERRPSKEARSARTAWLRRAMSELPPLEGDPDTGTTSFWGDRRRQIRRLVTSRDPMAFLTWDPIVMAMTFDSVRLVAPELRTLRGEEAWDARWRPSLVEDRVGLALPFPLYPASSGTLIHHAFHLLQLEQGTGRKVTDFERIVEFGGGYGGMARLIGRLGFRGDYHLHDLPELCLLQRFFLESVRDASPDRAVSPSFSSHLAEARRVLEGMPGALFIATWSLSETPTDTREQWRPLLDRCGAFLLGYQDRFDGIDNASWFGEYAASRPDVAWHHRPIAHRPGNAYWLGVSREGWRSRVCD